MLDFVLKSVVTVLIPFIQMFGLYVIFHGALSPGGSFAGGMILGLGFIALNVVFGLEKGQEKFSDEMAGFLVSLGPIWYGSIGLVGILRGANFLVNKDSGLPMGEPGTLLSGGMISLITLGIGIKVASTIVTLFNALTEEE